ncbi:MAG: hypothetical protein JNJ73_15795 [Hyphomonadaceae bacterium]|nr:hypothetical protein [Hyphomonadaceae bacterium]
MTLSKMSAIVAAYAATFEAAGDVEAAQQLNLLAGALKKRGRMDMVILSRILGKRS